MKRWYKGVTLHRVGISWYAMLWDGDRLIHRQVGLSWAEAKRWVNGGGL
jgi:hypothetical protein